MDQRINPSTSLLVAFSYLYHLITLYIPFLYEFELSQFQGLGRWGGGTQIDNIRELFGM